MIAMKVGDPAEFWLSPGSRVLFYVGRLGFVTFVQ